MSTADVHSICVFGMCCCSMLQVQEWTLKCETFEKRETDFFYVSHCH
jgi:hypothetical protein